MKRFNRIIGRKEPADLPTGKLEDEQSISPKDSVTELSERFGIDFPNYMRVILSKLDEQKSILVFKAYNNREFILVGSHLLSEKNIKALDQLVKLCSSYKEINNFYPIAYNSLDYYPFCLLMRKDGSIEDDDVYYFHGLEGTTRDLVNMGLKIRDLIPDNWQKYKRKSYYKIDNYSKSLNRFLEAYVIVDLYSEICDDFFEQLEPFLMTQGHSLSRVETEDAIIYAVNGDKTYSVDKSPLGGSFNPIEFLSSLEEKLDGYHWFKLFRSSDDEYESFGFGKIRNSYSVRNLIKRGYINRDVKNN